MKVERKGSRFREAEGREEIGIRFLSVARCGFDRQLDFHWGLRSNLEPESCRIMDRGDWCPVRSRNKPVFFDPVDVNGAS